MAARTEEIFMAPATKTASGELERQRLYAKGLADKGFDYGLAVGSAFVESMRNTLYRHTGTALDELVDNAIEAGATNIHVVPGFYGKSDAKPDALAVIDDGHGMVADMVRLSVLWGGTHREDSRTGFGRFGFGLPSASVNQARRFSVFSIVEGDRWHGITVDLDDIRAGTYNNDKGQVVAPPVTTAEPPDWLKKYVDGNFPNFGHGTVVLWEKLDRIKWKTLSTMTKHLLEHFGVTYRNYMSGRSIVFNGTRVEPTDPLFLTPGFRYFDLDEDLAAAREPAVFDVATKSTGEKVTVRVRYSYFPRTFFLNDKSKSRADADNQNARWSVTAANRGIIICRQGRQIDVVESTPWKGFEKFRNDDRYWAAEIDFPAELDEEFTIANSKQGVVMSERLWDLLDNAGMLKALRALRTEHQAEVDREKSKPEKEGEKRLSERSMEEGEKFRRKRTETDPVEREKKARENLEQYVKRTSREKNVSTDAVREAFAEEERKHPYKVEFGDLHGAPFFRVEQRGGMKVLHINRTHRFYTDLYASPDSTRFTRAALEVLLFSLGDCELDAIGNADKSAFYAVERAAWSEVLASGLEILSRFVHDTDVEEGEEVYEPQAGDEEVAA
jgi:hypothetical protein